MPNASCLHSTTWPCKGVPNCHGKPSHQQAKKSNCFITSTCPGPSVGSFWSRRKQTVQIGQSVPKLQVDLPNCFVRVPVAIQPSPPESQSLSISQGCTTRFQQHITTSACLCFGYTKLLKLSAGRCCRDDELYSAASGTTPCCRCGQCESRCIVTRVSTRTMISVSLFCKSTSSDAAPMCHS